MAKMTNKDRGDMLIFSFNFRYESPNFSKVSKMKVTLFVCNLRLLLERAFGSQTIAFDGYMTKVR